MGCFLRTYSTAHRASLPFLSVLPRESDKFPAPGFEALIGQVLLAERKESDE